MAPTLKVNFAGVSMPNPFMLSSAPPTTNVEMVARCFEAGWGGAVLKTLAYTPEPGAEREPAHYRGEKRRRRHCGLYQLRAGQPQAH